MFSILKKTLIFVLSMVVITILSCSKENDTTEPQEKTEKNIILPFKGIKKLDTLSLVLKKNKEEVYILESNEINIIECKNEKGEKIKFITPKNINMIRRWKIEYGYGFDGHCFVFGTRITGDNGVSIFQPCGIDCVGFPNICPDFGHEYV